MTTKIALFSKIHEELTNIILSTCNDPDFIEIVYSKNNKPYISKFTLNHDQKKYKYIIYNDIHIYDIVSDNLFITIQHNSKIADWYKNNSI